jgi:predicted amidohydrolase YtcJ
MHISPELHCHWTVAEPFTRGHSITSAKKARDILVPEIVNGGNLLLFNGRIRTLEARLPQVEAVLILCGRIVFLGSSEEAKKRAKGNERSIDLKGRHALPGFIDSHVHFWRTGMMEQMVDLRCSRTILEIQDAIRKQATKQEKGTLLMGRGWSDTNLQEQRYPTRHELDTAAPDHIVYLMHLNGHSCTLNSRAIEFLKLDPTRAGVETDSAGQAGGPLREKVAFESQGKLLTLMNPKLREACLDIVSKQAVEGGTTGVHCLEGGRLIGDPDVEAFLAKQHELPVSTVLYYQITDLEKVLSLGLPRIGGCVLIDGSPAAHTGALYEPYTDRPDTSGPEYWSQKDLNEWVLKCHLAGLQIVVHATCERAIGQMLSALENALLLAPREDHRHRIDHFYFPTQEQVLKAARLRVLAGVQPYFVETFEDLYKKRLGEERAKRVHPYRWFFDAGVIAGGGSDSFVTPIRPLWGIHAAVNHFNREQRISVKEAVTMFTYNSAYLAREEHLAGTLRVGKRGDLVILTDDVFATSPENIKQIKVEMTVSRGRVTYTSEEGACF